MIADLTDDLIIEKFVADRDLVFQFFFYFSRFEYCLKRSKKYLKKGRYDIAKPDWSKYSDDLNGKFATTQNTAFEQAVKSLIGAPPKHQVVREESLTWEDTKQYCKEHDEKYILRLVRTVRNNLFHGGKFPLPSGPTEDTARNNCLLQASISVLEKCIELSDFDSIFTETA